MINLLILLSPKKTQQDKLVIINSISTTRNNQTTN